MKIKAKSVYPFTAVMTFSQMGNYGGKGMGKYMGEKEMYEKITFQAMNSGVVAGSAEHLCDYLTEYLKQVRDSSRSKAVSMTVAGKLVIVFVPDMLLEEQKLQALWLIAPKGEDAAVWVNNTKVKEYAENAKAIVVCAPWDEQDIFYTEILWSALHEHFSALSDEPNDHRLLGLADSAERCLKFVFCYPEQFNIAVAVCPSSNDDCMELLSLVKAHMLSGKKRPRTVISDCAEGDGERMGNAINAYGVDMHVHAKRTVSGWALMDAEIKSCLDHL